MSQCPKCQTSIEIKQNQFGSLFTCPFCQAVFFVDWNGYPEAQAEEPVQELTQQPLQEERIREEEHQEPMFEPIAGSEEIPPAAEFVGSEENERPLSLEGAMGEVLEFANSPRAKLLRSYHIEIFGLDLQKDVQRLRDVLRDPKFKFDPDTFIERISHGNLKISDLSPIKAAILVRRLEMEHFEIRVTLES